MLSELRTLFYQVELVLPSLKGSRIGRPQVRALYNELHKPGGYSYDNLEFRGEGASLSTTRDHGRSVCYVGPDTIRIEEDKPEFGVDEFIDIVKTVLRALGDDFPPVVLRQNCRIQSIVKPRFMGSIKLLAHEVANVHDTIGPLGRLPTYFGVRFSFLPMDMILNDLGTRRTSQDEAATDDQLETGEIQQQNEREPEETSVDQIVNEIMAAEHNESDNARMTLRFETYNADLSFIWIEAAAEFHARTGIVFDGNDIDLMGQNVRDTYRFISERCTKFLEQFDKPPRDNGDEP
jgi:hypothetical protein